LNANTVNSNYQKGIHLDESDSNELKNNTVNSNFDGIYLELSDENKLNNNTANSNTYDGIHLSSSEFNGLNNNTVLKNDKGILLGGSDDNNLASNNASDNKVGFYLESSDWNTIVNNTITSNDVYGIELDDCEDNEIYNNYFNNSVNFNVVGGSGNQWNTAKTLGPNIVGGPTIGGNYWAQPNGTGFSQTCNDTDNDGFCDEQYNISSADYLPLNINASIDIEKSTNNEDADTSPGPYILEGDIVLWSYNVTNNGNVILNNINVTDDQGVEVYCVKDNLAPGESIICTS
jgi:parallel beta-helix repeat protein